MSLRKPITLRPPPNVDFVHGYPGIPPGNGRPPAEVMGSIEIRFGKEGMKAKWVRIAMRKIETLPGGALASTSLDFIGQSPQDLWVASEDYDVMVAKDFPFRIRLPETIPPSIILEKEAGIRYQLVASVCVKGKRGILRKDSSTIMEDITEVHIDKHELHSTWPIYNQPDLRSVSRDQLTLTASRARSCFSPGDRVSVTATLQANSFTPVHLRSFEFALVEMITYRSGPRTKSSKKTGPQIKVSNVGDLKVPMNANITGGMRHVAELSCAIPLDYPNATINSARHIDVGYKLTVKAILDNSKPFIIEMPVSVSNWQRNTSLEIVPRIGYAPNLSLGFPPPGQVTSNVIRESQHSINALSVPSVRSPLLDESRQSSATNIIPGRPATLNGAPPSSIPHPVQMSVDELGMRRPFSSSSGMSVPGRRSTYEEFGSKSLYGPTNGLALGSAQGDLLVVPESMHSTAGNGTNSEDSSSRRARTAGSNKLTVVNAEGNGSNEELGLVARSGTAFTTADEEKRKLAERDSQFENISYPPSLRTDPEPQSSAQAQWPSAQDEKKRLFDEARTKAAQMQRDGLSQSLSGMARPSSPATQGLWPTAEDEKRRLFEQARASVRRTQGLSVFNGSNITEVGFTVRQGRPGPGHSTSTSAISPGAVLYSDAMASVQKSRSNDAMLLTSSLASAASSSQTINPQVAEGRVSQSERVRAQTTYPTAEEEKAMLRYLDAKNAVKRNLAGDSSALRAGTSVAEIAPSGQPIPYDQLFPERSESVDDVLPPSAPYDVPGGNRDNAQPPGTSFMTSSQDNLSFRSPFKSGPPSPSIGMNPITPTSPPLWHSPTRRGTRKTSLPSPPSVTSGFKPLSAAEEKALLKSQYEAEEAGNPNNSEEGGAPSPPMCITDTMPQDSPIGLNNLSRDPTISLGKKRAELDSVPPPLMPRPPPHYIKDTQVEDERMQNEKQVTSQELSEDSSAHWLPLNTASMDISLSMRPFSPFDLGLPDFEREEEKGVPPPPLPPKIPLHQD